MVDIAKKTREATLRWYGHINRNDLGKLVRDIYSLLGDQVKRENFSHIFCFT
jgi:hypothetical protein